MCIRDSCSRIDRIRNETIRQELQVFNLNEKIKFTVLKKGFYKIKCNFPKWPEVLVTKFVLSIYIHTYI